MNDAQYRSVDRRDAPSEKFLRLLAGRTDIRLLFPALFSENKVVDDVASEFSEDNFGQLNRCYNAFLPKFNFVFRLLSVLCQVSQWGLLAVAVAQLPDDENAAAPNWLKALILPEVMLPAASVMNTIVTLYLVNLENVSKAYRPYKAICSKEKGTTAGERVKMLVTLLLGMAFAVAGAAFFLPVVTEPEQLSNTSLPNLVAYYEWLENNESAKKVNLAAFWVVNIIIQATAGLNLADSAVDFVAYYFLSPKVREAHRIRQRMQVIARTPDLNRLMRVLKRNYRLEQAEEKRKQAEKDDDDLTYSDSEKSSISSTQEKGLTEFLERMDNNLTPSWLFIAAAYEEHRQPGCSKAFLGFLRTNLTLTMNYGFISFALAALRTLPLYVSLPAILVTVVLTDGFSKDIVESLKLLMSKRSCGDDHGLARCATAILSVLGFLLIAYTSLIALPKTFDEELANCALMKNETHVTTASVEGNASSPCAKDAAGVFYTQLFFGALTIAVFNMAPVIAVVCALGGSVAGCVSKKNDKQKEVLQWREFENRLKERLTIFALSSEKIYSAIRSCLYSRGELRSLFLHCISEGPMVLGDADNTLTAALAHIGKESSFSAGRFSFPGNQTMRTDNHYGKLIRLAEKSKVWRIVSDLIAVLCLGAAFAYSVSVYDRGGDNPMHRLLDLINFLQQEIAIPLGLLWLGYAIPGSIQAVMACRGKAVTYWDPSSRCCGPSKDEITLVRSEVSITGCTTAASVLSALFLLPQMFFMYHGISSALAANIELDLEDFDVDSREITESFFEFFALVIMLYGAYDLGKKIQSSFATPPCAKKIEPGTQGFIAMKTRAVAAYTTYGSEPLI